MDVRILTALAEGLYELLLTPFLTLKTLYQVLLHPRWVRSYVTTEMAKPERCRYSSYLNPALFWVFAGVGSYTLFLVQPATKQAIEDSSLRELLELSPERMVVGLALYIASAPLGFAFGGHAIHEPKKTLVDRITLRPHFDIQCLIFGVFSLLVMPYVAYVIYDTHPAPFGRSLSRDWLLAPSISWLAVAEFDVLAKSEEERRETGGLRIAIGSLQVLLVWAVWVLPTMFVQLVMIYIAIRIWPS